MSIGLAALSASFVGCLSPTLPLPPPSRPTIFSPDDEGNIRITGIAQSRAAVFAHNLRTDQIVGEVTGDSGAYDLTMAAEVGDRISVWQSVDTKESAATEVLVPDNNSLTGTPPPAGMGGSSD